MINYTKLVEKAAPRIKQERERLGLEKKEVAAELGYGLSNYSSYETKTLPRILPPPIRSPRSTSSATATQFRARRSSKPWIGSQERCHTNRPAPARAAPALRS